MEQHLKFQNELSKLLGSDNTLKKIHFDVSSSSDSESDGRPLDEDYMRNQPPPCDYNTIKDSVIKIGAESNKSRKQKRKNKKTKTDVQLSGVSKRAECELLSECDFPLLCQESNPQNTAISPTFNKSMTRSNDCSVKNIEKLCFFDNCDMHIIDDVDDVYLKNDSANIEFDSDAEHDSSWTFVISKRYKREIKKMLSEMLSNEQHLFLFSDHDDDDEDCNISDTDIHDLVLTGSNNNVFLPKQFSATSSNTITEITNFEEELNVEPNKQNTFIIPVAKIESKKSAMNDSVGLYHLTGNAHNKSTLGPEKVLKELREGKSYDQKTLNKTGDLVKTINTSTFPVEVEPFIESTNGNPKTIFKYFQNDFPPLDGARRTKTNFFDKQNTDTHLYCLAGRKKRTPSKGDNKSGRYCPSELLKDDKLQGFDSECSNATINNVIETFLATNRIDEQIPNSKMQKQKTPITTKQEESSRNKLEIGLSVTETDLQNNPISQDLLKKEDFTASESAIEDKETLPKNDNESVKITSFYTIFDSSEVEFSPLERSRRKKHEQEVVRNDVRSSKVLEDNFDCKLAVDALDPEFITIFGSINGSSSENQEHKTMTGAKKKKRQRGKKKKTQVGLTVSSSAQDNFEVTLQKESITVSETVMCELHNDKEIAHQERSNKAIEIGLTTNTSTFPSTSNFNIPIVESATEETDKRSPKRKDDSTKSNKGTTQEATTKETKKKKRSLYSSSERDIEYNCVFDESDFPPLGQTKKLSKKSCTEVDTSSRIVINTSDDSKPLISGKSVEKHEVISSEIAESEFHTGGTEIAPFMKNFTMTQQEVQELEDSMTRFYQSSIPYKYSAEIIALSRKLFGEEFADRMTAFVNSESFRSLKDQVQNNLPTVKDDAPKRFDHSTTNEDSRVLSKSNDKSLSTRNTESEKSEPDKNISDKKINDSQDMLISAISNPVCDVHSQIDTTNILPTLQDQSMARNLKTISNILASHTKMIKCQRTISRLNIMIPENLFQYIEKDEVYQNLMIEFLAAGTTTQQQTYIFLYKGNYKEGSTCKDHLTKTFYMSQTLQKIQYEEDTAVLGETILKDAHEDAIVKVHTDDGSQCMAVTATYLENKMLRHENDNKKEPMDSKEYLSTEISVNEVSELCNVAGTNRNCYLSSDYRYFQFKDHNFADFSEFRELYLNTNMKNVLEKFDKMKKIANENSKPKRKHHNIISSYDSGGCWYFQYKAGVFTEFREFRERYLNENMDEIFQKNSESRPCTDNNIILRSNQESKLEGVVLLEGERTPTYHSYMQNFNVCNTKVKSRGSHTNKCLVAMPADNGQCSVNSFKSCSLENCDPICDNSSSSTVDCDKTQNFPSSIIVRMDHSSSVVHLRSSLNCLLLLIATKLFIHLYAFYLENIVMICLAILLYVWINLEDRQ